MYTAPGRWWWSLTSERIVKRQLEAYVSVSPYINIIIITIQREQCYYFWRNRHLYIWINIDRSILYFICVMCDAFINIFIDVDMYHFFVVVMFLLKVILYFYLFVILHRWCAECRVLQASCYWLFNGQELLYLPACLAIHINSIENMRKIYTNKNTERTVEKQTNSNLNEWSLFTFILYSYIKNKYI